MSRKSLFQIVSLLAVLAMLAACGGQATPAQAPTQAPAAEPTAAPVATTAPAAAGGKVMGKFYWVQGSAWHPVHQLTQLAFLDGCKELGLQCELATTDENTIDAVIAIADQTVARPDAKGVAMWAGGLPVFKPIIEKAKAAGVAIALPHFPVPEGTFADNAVQIAADFNKWPDPIAKGMCDELKKQGVTKGSVAITENNHNVTEDGVAKVFAESMTKYCPDLKILPVELEGPEPTKAIAAAVSIIQANPDIVAGFSTTGGGPTTWAGAQKETGKKLVAVGMDYTRVNLDLIKSGEIFGIAAQPLYDECKGAAELLFKMANGEKVPYWTLLEAPLVTKDNMTDFYAILDRLEPQMRPAVNPDEAKAAAKVTGKFYWVQGSAWHPVHQLTQLAFLDGCKELGLQCELATTDENTIDAVIAIADQTVARPDAKGVAMWAGGLPVFKPIIEKAKAAGVAIALPHFPVPEGTFADNAVQIAADFNKWPDPIAKGMCDELKKQGVTKGSVAITENNHNVTEDGVAKVFAESMTKYCPDLKILPVELEGPEPTKAIAAAVSIIQANPDIVAGFSTTGGGPTTWAGAQKETGKKLVAVGMDYTRVNLDLIKSGEIFGIAAQPLYDECKGAAELLFKMANGEKVPYWTLLEAPLVTKDNMTDFYAILDRLEPQMRPAVNPDEAKAAAKVTGKFYWVQGSAWHPVHQLTQLAFLDGCKELGLQCELATTDENTIDAVIAIADQTVARPDAKGVAMWAGGLPVFKPIIEKAKAAGVAIALPHFPVPEGTFADNAVQIAADFNKWPDPIAKGMCDELKKQGVTKGSVAITENNHNVTEDGVAKVFAESMTKYCPDLKILPVELEGPEPTKAIAAAVSIIQANPDIVAGFSTTGGGPTTWAGAQKETGKKLVAVGMDYTRVNLDLIKSGEIFGIAAQPLYDECKGAAELLFKMANGEKVPYWTLLEAPLVTKDNMTDFYAILDRLEPQMRPAVNPDDKK